MSSNPEDILTTTVDNQCLVDNICSTGGYSRYDDGEYKICLNPREINDGSFYGTRNGILGYWNKTNE